MAEDKKQEIFNKVSEIVADHFDVDRAKITDELKLKTDLDADSIDFVEFVYSLFWLKNLTVSLMTPVLSIARI